jgi:hypothetical protein
MMRLSFPAFSERLFSCRSVRADDDNRLLTWRTLLLGGLGVLSVSILSGYHDNMLAGGTLMVGSHLPVWALCHVMAAGLLWNGVAGRLWRRAALSSREMAVVLAVTLVACYPPTSGLCRYFQRGLMLPWHYLTAGGKAEWIRHGVLEHLPARLFPRPYPVTTNHVFVVSEEVDTVYRGYVTGLAQGRRTLSLGELPLSGWLPCLLGSWLPLIVAVSICLMALLLLLHRQWSRHEQLSYPLAQVTGSFTDVGAGRVPAVFRSRVFWCGCGAMLFFYAIEYLSLWFPESVPGMSRLLPALKSWWVPLDVKVPVITKTPSWWALPWQTTYFSVMGLAYFCGTDVSLTVGLAPLLLCLGGVWYYTAGGVPLTGGDVEMARAGAYLGYTLILLYTGRVHLRRVFRDAFRRGGGADRVSVLAARIFMLSFAAVVLIFVSMGQDWLVALFYTLVLTSMMLVLTRVVCETGIPFMQTGWYPIQLLTALAGPAAIGPGPAVFFSWVSVTLCEDPRESLLPFVATGLRVAEERRVRLDRLFLLLTVALLVALAAAFLTTTWVHYNFGAMQDGYASVWPPQAHFNRAARLIGNLEESGLLAESRAATGLAKLGLVRPEGGELGFVLAGLAAVIVFALLRFRFSRFPLHPVLFIIMGTYAAGRIWFSFLLGWAAKVVVVRFGGNRFYQALKPFFFGIIAGELGAGGLTILFDMLHLAITGRVPPVMLMMLSG